MCNDMTEIRVIDSEGKHGCLTWYWPTVQLDKVVSLLSGVTVRDSVGARYSHFNKGTLVFSRTGVHYEIVASVVNVPPVAV